MSIPGSMLNMENIIRKVFDHTTDTLKTTAVGGPSGIIISSADDSIAIGNVAGDLMTVNPNGSIDANLVGITPVSGRLPVDIGGATVNITGPVTVSNEVEIKNDAGNPIPVNGTVSVTGVATLTEQQTQTSVLNSIDSKLTSPVAVSATNLDIRDLAFATDKVDVSGSAVSVTNTVAVSASALPLPSGASTLAEQQTQSSTLVSIDNNTSTIAANSSDINTTTADILVESQNQTILQNDILNKLNSSVEVTATNLDVRDLVFATDKVDASGSSVSVTNFPAIQPVSATNLDIRDLTFAADKVDTSGSVVALDSATLAALENTTVSVDNFPVNQNVTVQNPTLAVTQSGTWSVNNVTGTVSLPTGASTSALQTTINSSIGTLATNQLSGSQKSIVRGGAKGTTLAGDVTSSNIDANTQALDVAIKEIPAVALDASTLAALETVSINNFPSLVDVTGSEVTVSNVVDVNITGGNVTINSEVEIKNDVGNPVPVSGSVSVTGVSTLTEQQAQTTVLNSIDSKLTSPVTISANNLDVRDLVFATDKVDTSGSAVTVSNTVAVSAISLPLPTGAATSALQSTGNTSLNSIDTKLTTYNSTISVTDISNARAVNGAVTVTTTATAINVSGANLANRKNITIYNNSATVGNILYYGFSTGVTTSNGFPLARNTSVSFELGPNVTVYLIATSGSHNVRVVELS